MISTFASPLTPLAPNSIPGHFGPQIRLIVTLEPRSVYLLGQMRISGITVVPSSSRHRSPTTAPSWISTWLFITTFRHTVAPRTRLLAPR